MDDTGFPPLLAAHGLSGRKRHFLADFLPTSRVQAWNGRTPPPPSGAVVLWGGAECPPLARNLPVIRVEDGFLRSVGLGADLTRPVSWVLDRRGIYFDSTRPSDLEQILSETVFDDTLLLRAATLRQRIVETRLTKYNVGARGWRRSSAQNRRVILVPGQVETDASIRLGAPGIKTNMGLLRAVRDSFPQAYVVYKIHPDVLAKLRAEGQGEGDARQWCDEVVADISMADMLDAVDEVHTMTSLAGFEALMRGLPVTCYGQPFYSGWGLTQDIIPLPRRQRRLTLDELTAGALILYPRYMGRLSAELVSPEQALDELIAWRNNQPADAKPSLGLRAWRLWLRLIGWFEGRR